MSLDTQQVTRPKSIAGVNHRNAKDRHLDIKADQFIIEFTKFTATVVREPLELINFWQNFCNDNGFHAPCRSAELLRAVIEKYEEGTIHYVC